MGKIGSIRGPWLEYISTSVVMKKKCLRNAVAASVSDRPTARAGNTLGMFCLSITFITCLDAACPTGPRKILRRPRMSPGFGTRPAGRAVVALLPFFSVPHLGDTGGKRATVIPGKHVHKLTAFFFNPICCLQFEELQLFGPLRTRFRPLLPFLRICNGPVTLGGNVISRDPPEMTRLYS